MKQKDESKKITEEEEKDLDLETIKKLIRKKEIQTTVLKKIIQQTNHSQNKNQES